MHSQSTHRRVGGPSEGFSAFSEVQRAFGASGDASATPREGCLGHAAGAGVSARPPHGPPRRHPPRARRRPRWPTRRATTRRSRPDRSGPRAPGPPPRRARAPPRPRRARRSPGPCRTRTTWPPPEDRAPLRVAPAADDSPTRPGRRSPGSHAVRMCTGSNQGHGHSPSCPEEAARTTIVWSSHSISTTTRVPRPRVVGSEHHRGHPTSGATMTRRWCPRSLSRRSGETLVAYTVELDNKAEHDLAPRSVPTRSASWTPPARASVTGLASPGVEGGQRDGGRMAGTTQVRRDPAGSRRVARHTARAST